MSKTVEQRDFPFYNGQPFQISIAKWLVVMAACAIGFASTFVRIPFLSLDINGKLVPFLFTGIPLIAFAWASKGQLGTIFRKIRGRDVGWALLFLLFNWIVTVVVGLLLQVLKVKTVADAGLSVDHNVGLSALIWKFVAVGIQLVGEELLTILPFLFIMQLCVSYLKLSKKAAITIALIITAAIFGAMHLPTYHWNIVQAVVGIGMVRLVLTGCYLKTKNIWASSITHILNDWAFLVIGMLGSATPFITHFFQ